jgi:hypothetical protein
MSEITEFEQLMPLLDQTDLSEVNVHLDNKLALDISDFVKSKGIHHDKMCNWFCQISKTTISTKVLVSRLHRLKTLVSKKRGEKKSMLLEELFEIDTSEASAKQAPQALKEPVESLVQKLENTEQKHLNDIQSMKRKYENTSEEKEKEIKKIKKANQNLEFKVQKQSNTIKQLRYHSKMLKLQKSRQASYVLKFKSNIRQLQKNLQATENLKTVNLAQVTKLERKFTSIQRNCNDAMTQANEKSATIDRLKSELNDSQQTIDYFHDLLQDNKDINIFDEQSRAYTPEYRNLVMNVSGYNVATENINSVINESLKLVGKRLAQTPTRKTIDNIVTEKVVVSNIQVGRELEKKERTTLYSDETRKFGKTYNSYFISDQNKNVYMLGLREMNNKAASTTLDTFKEILSDISDLCDENLENNKLSSGYHILCNIRDFMSDRAKTNIAFTQLLIDYRKDIMPDVIDGWNDFTEEQKNACSKINNFFCGLHLLVNFAECASPALKEFDALYKDQGESDVIGELENEFQADERDEIFLSKFDGQVLTLLRFCAKSFARGVDEKSGCFSDFSSYCRDKNEKNNFISFRGNRFNIIFLMGEIVYYHKNHVIDFLKNVHGANNFLQKATLALSLSNVVIAQCKVLGLVSKLITGPLWRLLEQNKHVLDMNAHYETLLNFLDSNSKDANSFINCETFPFDQTLVHKDKFYECLKMQNEIIDSIAVQVAQTLFIAFHKLLKVAMKDQLPGGLYYVPNPDLVEDTLSVIPHNKLPERAFGMLDFMVRHRPNATILTNEAFVTFSFNKTSDWLDSLPRAERDKILNDARKRSKNSIHCSTTLP